MNVRAKWNVLLGVIAAATLLCGVGLADDPAGTAADTGDGLKWTPHRPTRVADASASTAPPVSEPVRQVEPPVAPAADAMPAPMAVIAAPTAPPPIRSQLPPATVRPDPPVGTLGLGGIQMPSMRLFRTPPGESGRPMTTSGVTAGDYRSQPLSMAPRFDGQSSASSRPAQRPPRFAMNADDLPSVMSQAPGKTPAGPQAGPTPMGDLPPPMTGESFGAESFHADHGMAGGGMPGGDVPFEMETSTASSGMWMGGYPDGGFDPFAVDPCCPEDQCGFCPGCSTSGRFCAWLRQFGRPYYGWRWYRDFTASVGITGFEAPADLGIGGNFGVNEYANFGMPFWNAFGIGWQLGVRGVQADFQRTTINGLTDDPFRTSIREQVFLTTGFYTRAFEGRGLQFGAVWDYQHDNWYDNVNLAQIRGEISYVWHAHEVGFWGSANYDTEPFTTRAISGNASTIDLYALFYRLHFGDANEWKVWGGGTENGDGLIGTLFRAPMSRSLALEGTFTYLIPGNTTTYPLGTDDDGDEISITTADAAWNVSVNVVFYPACRSRRGLASPYRPLFEVADNGSMIRSLEGLTGPTP
jgi:hypothetical protein